MVFVAVHMATSPARVLGVARLKTTRTTDQGQSPGAQLGSVDLRGMNNAVFIPRRPAASQHKGLQKWIVAKFIKNKKTGDQYKSPVWY